MKYRPFTRVRLMLDRCTLNWKVGDCTAAGSTPCYKTRATCQAAAAYSATATALALCTAEQPVPPSIQAFPCVKDIEHVPTKIDMKAGLGRRDQVVVTCSDFQDGSELTDPYWARRASRCMASFFAVLKARNRHYAGRTMYVDTGMIGDDGRIVEAAMTTQRYIIENINGPANGQVTITAKDVLWKLETAQVPAPSAGELAAAIATAGATTFSFKTGDGAAYGTAPFVVRIDDEIMTVGARTDDACSSVSRGAYGSTAATHDVDAKVQLCKVWTAEAVDTVWSDILTDGGIDSGLQDTTNAATEVATWFGSHLLTAVISQPTKAADLLADLAEQLGAFTWWDSEQQLVKFKGVHPAGPDETLQDIDDSAHVIGRSVSIRDDDGSRISRVDCCYGVRNWAEDLGDEANYLRRIIAIDASAESASEYNEVRDTRRLFAYFCPTSLETTIEAHVYRILERYRDAPRYVTLDLTTDDATTAAGGLLNATVRELVDADGAAASTTCWVLARSKDGGDSIVYRYELLVDRDQTSARWWFWNADTAADYDSATDEEKRCSYWADDATELVGDDPPYCWI